MMEGNQSSCNKIAKLLDKLKNKIKNISLPKINLSRFKQILSNCQKKGSWQSQFHKILD